MRRIVCLLAGVLLPILSLGSDTPKGYDGRTQVVNPLNGTWRPLKVEMTSNGGGKIICAGPEWADIVFQDGKYAWNWGDQYYRIESSRGTCTFDPLKNPGHLDLSETAGTYKGVTIRCIYRMDADKLEIASMTGHPEMRPGCFEGPVTVYTLKRKK